MIGEQFGNYRSVALLGEGGMGSVYLAEHPGIGRRVAVKVLHKNYSRDEHLLARFLNEARAANAIRHPNIIEILDSGTLADGTPFLVMELLEGDSLGTRLRSGIMPIATALDFAYQTASALGAAHAKGIVHRDLKPDNLFVVNDPHDTTRERIKVLDFGIAKLQQASTADSVKTRTGTLMGTPIYMSPEQCRGTRSVDHRSDIYSLGVIIYEMLAGQTPFVSEGFGELVNMHLNVLPASARSKRPEIPPALDTLVLKMLAKNPEDRYANMAEVQGALKTSGGSQFTVRGSSPDLGKTQAPKAAVTETSPMHDTFGASSGERLGTTQPAMRGGTKLMIGGLAAAVAVAAGLLVLRGGGGEVKTLDGPVAIVKRNPPPDPPPAAPTAARPPAPVPTPTPTPTLSPAPKKVELRLVSLPPGALVRDDADGAVLGTTPLVLTRPFGGSIKVRLEKDGFGPSTRTLDLDGDHTLELTLPEAAPKAKARPRPPRPWRDTSSEPAKL